MHHLFAQCCSGSLLQPASPALASTGWLALIAPSEVTSSSHTLAVLWCLPRPRSAACYGSSAAHCMHTAASVLLGTMMMPRTGAGGLQGLGTCCALMRTHTWPGTCCAR